MKSNRDNKATTPDQNKSNRESFLTAIMPNWNEEVASFKEDLGIARKIGQECMHRFFATSKASLNAAAVSFSQAAQDAEEKKENPFWGPM